MPWRDGPGGGFTTGRPWLPLPPDLATRNAAAQAADPGSVFAWYRDLLRVRRETPALHLGDQNLLDTADTDVLAWIRRGPDGPAALIALNFALRDAALSLPPAPGGGQWRLALTTGSRPAGAPLAGATALAPLEALVAIEG
jgi:alpha-glucosidase